MEAKGKYAWKPLNRVRPISYALKNYAMLATSADKGAVRNRELLDEFVGESTSSGKDND